MIENHLNEYKQQAEQHRAALIALNGAIQALERLQVELQERDKGGQGAEADSVCSQKHDSGELDHA